MTTQALRKRICVLPGDGIGIEVMEAALPVIAALNLPFDLIAADIGWECWRAEGETVPARTWEIMASCDATLLGAITSKPLAEAEAELPLALQGQNRRYVSPVIQLRQNLDLYANVRPVSDMTGENRFRFVVIRENTEGLYAGLDFGCIPDALVPLLEEREALGAAWQREGQDDATVTLRLQTRSGLTRIFEYAFEYARKNHFTRVTFVDKPMVLRHSSAFARGIFEATAQRYPDVTGVIENVDAVALWMVQRPERFGVIVAENMFGDILSDLGAGVMGGLGFAPSGNFGNSGAYFEPVHGSAPAHAGLNKGNPGAMFMAIALMLDHLGFPAESACISQAVSLVSRTSTRTYDLGGSHTTAQVGEAIVQQCIELQSRTFGYGNEQVAAQGERHVSAL
ncbi:isocitrate/isopropylmalate dehydrogenase family protein [Pseudomonas syringae]|uniref:isocitrate/isopropylmalate dehydrogenase family protein n=1 Tax=Pseudomonas syringae TaxID=317 RepID=UPI000412798A|nr:isocitrate/isopropylmalate family dehydrogenase [Pseudomonas syringae]MBI6674572.1 isocitrate/isopropylmalate dehydrogenase family protein [Pseudomonas syringae]UOF18013.1 isocitrate/isopropylmalate family dehydrogenase [Pseudomonas syringae CC440]UZA80361.1 isocitrate/isopropylmalate dehydrogenase family protein [Pseudomonas syringae]